ncbi:DUF1016 family protein [Patescibacteria group bacterium]|nr:DUF1016 family protein [Patescibacteria group bacterium]
MLKKNNDYSVFLEGLKKRVRIAQVKAVLSVNCELVFLYWSIGRDILVKQEELGWGAKVIDNLSNDLSRAFPDMKGFSPRNLKFMRSFAEAYLDEQIVKQLASQIPWWHNIRILQQIKDLAQRIWYIRQTIENGWSRNVLTLQIKSGLYERQGSASTNFRLTLPKPQSDLAQQLLKDPYNFDFLSLGKEYLERDVEKALTAHICDFLLELGVGFAFYGSQVLLEVGDEDFYVDLLFYHVKLRCYIIVELKTGKFKPEYAGKMNFYLSAVDDLMRHIDDQSSIGIILCQQKNRIVAEYSLRDNRKPIGVSNYELTQFLPEKLQKSLPSVKELEAVFKEDMEEGGKNIDK